jgi:hypothetical protein
MKGDVWTMTGSFREIYMRKEGVKTKRISSYDITGGNKDRIEIRAGETAEIASIQGPGVIRHIWITLASPDPFIRRNAVIRMFWEGAEYPSVECPLGDFFGQGWGEEYNFISLPVAAAPKQGKGLNCYFPMPFLQHAKITVENESDSDITGFYYYVDYEEHQALPSSILYFHAWWNRELTEAHDEGGEMHQGINKSDRDNYLIAELEGKGHFVGIHYFIDNPTPFWYGEGDDMWMIDGEPWPGSLHGTGTEDFFNSAWCPNELYLHPYFGYAKVPDRFGFLGRTHCYRFFLEDPIYFEKSLRASIEHGHNNTMIQDICTVAYWYQTLPHKKFPPFPARARRANMPPITAKDVHLWRQEWRKAMGNGKTLWGKEKRAKQQEKPL